MLAGRPPYRGDTALAVMAQHVQARPPPLRTQNRKVSPTLEAAVMKALRRDPAERYRSMADFKHDLTHLSEADVSALEREDPAGRARRAARPASPPGRLRQMLNALFRAGSAK
jgi:serine/threonine-protein kinase